jgi:hypothetical protein
MGEGSSGYIESMEAAGQQQLVHSDRLPTQVHDDGKDKPYKKLGFTFGKPDPSDPLFRAATLPEGWRREGSDHSMWSYLVDQHGRRRVSIFYKAAFYDRSAFMRLETPYGYLRQLLHGDGQPVLDDEWLTPEVADETLAALRDRARDEATKAREYAARPQGDGDYWTQRAAEHDAEAEEAEAMRLAIAKVTAS